MLTAPKGIVASILLVLVAAVATVSWIVLFLRFLALDHLARYLLFLLGPILAVGALGPSMVIRFLARRARGRTSMSVASLLFAGTLVLLSLNSWEWHKITTGVSYCTGCMQFIYLPLLGIFIAVGGFISEMIGIWQWGKEEHRPRDDVSSNRPLP